MAERTDNQVEQLVLRPVEGMAVELKSWIDIRTPDGIAKLVKSLFALRNRDGGFLLIGFDDKTRAPIAYPFIDPAHAIFHADELQSLLSRYASQPFAIEAQFPERDGQIHPVVQVPSGVRVPVIVKADLAGEGGKNLLRVGDLYFRTLRANNMVSSARILPADYPDLMDVCFNNREGDFGGFLRRQIGQTDMSAMIAALRDVLGVQEPIPSAPNLRDRGFEIIAEGNSEFCDAVERRGLSGPERVAIGGLTMEVGLALEPEKENEVPTRKFLDVLAGANPQYTGWPIWLDSRGFNEKGDRPVVKDGAWQALIVDVESGWGGQHLEFMRLDPKGCFYLRRAMQDDLTEKVDRGTSLDVFLMLIRVTEVLAVGLSFARAAGWEDDTQAGFAFRWSGLEGRRLGGWANPLRSFGFGGGRSATEDAESFVAVPVDTPHAALEPYVSIAVRSLFSVFDGYEPPQAVVEDAVKRLIERRLG
jgi:hypothetical protein